MTWRSLWARLAYHRTGVCARHTRTGYAHAIPTNAVGSRRTNAYQPSLQCWSSGHFTRTLQLQMVGRGSLWSCSNVIVVERCSVYPYSGCTAVPGLRHPAQLFIQAAQHVVLQERVIFPFILHVKWLRTTLRLPTHAACFPHIWFSFFFSGVSPFGKGFKRPFQTRSLIWTKSSRPSMHVWRPNSFA